MQEIQHFFDGKKGSFYIEINNEKLATMDYLMAGNTKLIIEHTEVNTIEKTRIIKLFPAIFF
jgi:predicted GNAT family acetyltransferase